MSRSAEPALGDSVIGHDPETAQAYRLAAQEAARRQASSLPPAGSRGQSPAPVAPAEPQLPMVNVARALAGRVRSGRLRKQADDLERDLQRGVIGAGGSVVEHLVVRQREIGKFLEDINAEIARLSSLDDEAVRSWAAKHGAR